MPTDNFDPDLSKLDKDYQLLTELHGDGDSRTYLARHLRLNRDVTVTIFRGPSEGDGDSLALFADDARLLTTNRHPNVVPVIEGLWLDDKTFAIVRARVRGASLAHVIESEGPVGISRVAATVHSMVDAVSWARDEGVVHRRVSPESVVFQQGSGRVLLSFEPVALATDRLLDNAEDAHTIGELAAGMLAGERAAEGSESSSGIVVPSQIIPSVAEALEAVRQSDHSNASAAIESLVAALDAAAEASPAQEIASASAAALAQAEPVTTAAANEPTAVVEKVVPPKVERAADIRRVASGVPVRAVLPNSHPDKPVVVVKPRFSFNARLGTALAVVVVVGGLGFFAYQRSNSPVDRRAAASSDTTGTAAGEVAPRKAPDTSAMVYAPAPGPITARPPLTSSPTAIRVTDSTGSRSAEPPRNEQPKTAPVVTRTDASRDSAAAERKRARAADSATTAERQFKRDSAADVVDVCQSSATSDQHTCLMNAIDRNDRELNGVYARLVEAMRRQAGTAPNDPDPDGVAELRATQRRWVNERDVACRDVGEQPFYARSRSACFAQLSTDRARALEKMLSAIPPGD